MKLYEVNQAIEEIFEQMVDPETGEIMEDAELSERLFALEMEKERILEFLAKLVLNNKASISALKEEEKRLKERRGVVERKTERLMQILDRECAGQKTDLGVATVSYRKTAKVEVANSEEAIEKGYTDCYRVLAPEISKIEVKKLLASGQEIPGVSLTQDYSCYLR